MKFHQNQQSVPNFGAYIYYIVQINRQILIERWIDSYNIHTHKVINIDKDLDRYVYCRYRQIDICRNRQIDICRNIYIDNVEIDRQIYVHRNRQIDICRNRQIDNVEIDRQIYVEIDRQIYVEIDRQIYAEIYRQVLIRICYDRLRDMPEINGY